MPKRYYCDYCDRSFIDDIDSRKKHLQGANHDRNKKLYYKYCRDLKTLVTEERAKEECRRFRQTGQCMFGDHCNFTHYSRLELDSYMRLVAENEKQKEVVVIDKSVDDWLLKRRKQETVAEEALLVALPGPPPPSLTPLTISDITTPLSTWGS